MNKSITLNKTNAMKVMLLMLLLLCSFFYLSTVNAQIIAEDSFEGYAVGNISGNDGGAGWSGAWTRSPTSQAKVIDTSASPLTYTASNGDTILGGDKAIQLTQNSSEVAKRNLLTSYNNTTIYASMLIRFNGTQDHNDFIGNWLGSSSTYVPNFGIKMNTGPSGSDFFSRTRLGSEVYSTNITNGRTYFLVMKLTKTGDSSSSYNQAQLWVNPSSLVSEPTASTTISTGDSAINQFSTIGFRTLNLDTDDAITIDRIIYATTWDDVTQLKAQNGLQANYWNYSVVNNQYNMPTSEPDVTQIDPTVDFNWANSSPVNGINQDLFAIRWEGEFEALESGRYVFLTESDDGVRLWVNNQLIIDKWSTHSASWDYSTGINLAAGKRYSIRMEYFENNVDAVARLYWETPSNTTRHVIPESQLYPYVTPRLTKIINTNACQEQTNQLLLTYNTSMKTGSNSFSADLVSNYSVTPNINIESITATDATNTEFLITFSSTLDDLTTYTLNVASLISADGLTSAPVQQEFSVSSGNGLQADYWNYDINGNGYLFPTTAPTISQIDSEINFNWASNSPVTGINADRYAVRWQGSIQAPETGNYTFTTRSDDGVRLWVNNQLIVDNWNNHGATYNDSPLITLTAGERYTIKMEYFENGGLAVAQLYWITPSDSTRQIIPQSALFSCNLSPKAAYLFDEARWQDSVSNEVLDSSGNELHGMAIDTRPTAGLVCNAVDLTADSSTDRVILDHQALDNANDFTISIWAKSASTSKDQTFISGSNASEDNEFLMFFRNRTGFAPHIDNQQQYQDTIPTIADNQWHHYVWTRQGSNSCFFRDSVELSCRTVTDSIIDIDPNGLILGQEQESVNGDFDIFQDFEGLIDELLIFDKAISRSKIQEIYTNNLAGKRWDGKAISCPAPLVIDHFRLSYSSNGLTCLPSSVTLSACENSDCSSLYTQLVDVTLAGAGEWSVNPVSLTAGTSSDLTFQASDAGDTSVAISGSSITANNALKCYQDDVLDTSCTIPFSEAGFVFDVPTVTSCKTSTDVTIRAVQLDQETNQCTSALTGNQSINFFSSYIIPASGSVAVAISGNDIETTSPGTAVTLTFNADGEATFTTQYDDAGEIRLDARYDNGDGLTLSGNDRFVAKPTALYVYTDEVNANCDSGSSSCSLFKKAGENFNLKVKAACWQSDFDSNYADNPTTPNFELPSIGVSSNLVAPTGGNNGSIATTNFDFASTDDGIHTMSQSVSEVGVFTFTVSPPAYLGEMLTVKLSENIGRFYPDHLAVSSQNNGEFGNHSCGSFTYTGQSFTYQSAPELTISAYNVADMVTTNYTGGFAKLSVSDFSVAPPSTDANQLGADNTNLVSLLWSPSTPTLSDNSDGSHTFQFSNDSYQYVKQSNSQIAPFSNAINLSFTTITDSDGIETQSLPVTLQPSGETIRFGRFAISSAHGSELIALPITLSAEFFNGINWEDNTVDQCTSLNLSTHMQLSSSMPSSWQAGTATMTLGEGTTVGTLSNNAPFSSGKALLTFSAPGEDNRGFIDVRSSIATNYNWLLGDYDSDGNYDDEATGRASFGLFKGSENIIFMRELY